MLEARALDIKPLALEVLVVQQLKRALAQRFPEREKDELVPAAAQVGRLLAAAGVRLVVILDAVNEAPDWEQFAANWLPAALAWCAQHGFRLVLSCREESWTTVAGAARLRSDQCFVPRSLPKPSPDSAMSWCVRLGDFDELEAREAAVRYGISYADDPGTHPLMFRIASELHSNDPGESGRLLMLKRYIKDRLTRIASKKHMGNMQLELLEVALQEFADLLPPGGEGGVPLRQALRLVGDNAILEALVDEGLLSRSAGHVRFRYDQLGDSMRSIAPETLRGFSESLKNGGQGPDAQDIAAATITLLRLESELREKEYEFGIDLLLTSIAASGANHFADEDVMAGAERVARALPKRRSSDMRRIHAAIVQHGAWWRGAVACTEGALLPAAERAGLLLDLMPAARILDGTGYPLRWRDWQESDRRYAFESESREFSSVLGALRRLLQRHREPVLEVLWKGICDKRRVGSEASVASACAGLLFLDAAEHLDETVEHLLQVDSTLAGHPDSILESHWRLANSLVEHAPDLVARLLVHAFERGDDSYMLVLMLSKVHALGSEIVRPAIYGLFSSIKSLPDRPNSGCLLAHELRRWCPDEVEGWDLLARSWQIYDSFGRLPAARSAEAIARMAREGVAFAECVLADHVGTCAEQRLLVRGVVSALAIERGRQRLGRLLERRLDKLESHFPSQRPWLALTLAVVRDHKCEYRAPLVFRAFSSVDAHWCRRVRRQLIDYPDPLEWPETIKSLATWATTDECWSAWYRRARRHGPELVDRIAWRSIAMRFLGDECMRFAQRLLNSWKDVADPSEFASAILARLETGESLGDLLKVLDGE
ncbi:hypothetical protein WK15_19300 [Burkholderia ubonensis]|nr:hypothetical protein [Burkholderia ubonensis]KVR24631.1 hypothetical protein WK15_19300 [Burkholderia ubonensis]